MGRGLEGCELLNSSRVQWQHVLTPSQIWVAPKMWYIKCISNVYQISMVHYLVHWHVIFKTNIFATKGEMYTTGDHEAPRPFVQSDSSASLVAAWAMRTYSTITGLGDPAMPSHRDVTSTAGRWWSIVKLGLANYISSRESKWKLSKLSHIISPFNLSVSTQHVRVVRGNITHLLSTNTGAVPSNSGLFEVRSYRSYDETTQLPTNILEMGVTTYDIKWYNPDTVHIYLASTPHWVVYQVQIC